jgi:hypothetical protein
MMRSAATASMAITGDEHPREDFTRYDIEAIHPLSLFS